MVAATLLTAASLVGCGRASGTSSQVEGDSSGSSQCTPATCDSKALACGVADDGCGGTIDCGPCASLAPAGVPPLGMGCADVTLAHLPRPVTLTEQLPANAEVTVGTSDGAGHLAVGYRDDQFIWHWRLLDSSGNDLGQASGLDMYTLVPRADGFDTAVLTSDGPNQGLEVRRLSGSGQLLRTTTVLDPHDSMLASIGWRMAEASSGPVVATLTVSYAGNHIPALPVWSIRDGSTSATHLGSLDTDRGGTFFDLTPVPDGSVFAVSVFVRYVEGAWFEGPSSASVGSNEFSADYQDFGGFPEQVAALWDGTIVFGNGARWFTVAATRTQGLVPAPSWLKELPGSRLERLSGGRGYVVLPREADPTDCTYRVELRDRTGALCQTLEIDGDPGACEPDALRVGADGTLLQLRARTCTDAGCTVERRWWPQIFAVTAD